MVSLKTEFLTHTQGKKVKHLELWSPATDVQTLNLNYTPNDYNRILSIMDSVKLVDTQARYGISMTIVYEDGSHSTWDTYFVHHTKD